MLLAPIGTYWPGYAGLLSYQSFLFVVGPPPVLLWLDCVIGFVDKRRKQAGRKHVLSFKKVSVLASSKGGSSV